MEIEDIICEKVAQAVATHRITDCYNSYNDMKHDFEKEVEEVKFNKELRTVVRKLLDKR